MENATLEIVRATLGSILVESLVDLIMEKVAEQMPGVEPENQICNDPMGIGNPVRTYIEKNTSEPVSRPAKAEADAVDREESEERARAEAKGVDPLNREQIRMVLDQGGYIRVEIAARRYTLYENESSPVCLLSEDTWNDLIIEGEIICDAGERKPGTTIWIGA